ncbi:phosphoribosyltransferase [Phytoactinopolyspora halotolerans]|uniref:Phosphoribosyltransferase n=1 Tax=Phytoactinopolyspora halotolerans TaxID=1981512 RepID=A0A6L9S2I5_9ACTN|nr:phosphoribosyltransferase family protein [Phytoactinopolyspora halotolerans]NED99282.1 phosphoribosyltransferase [Phytoactinopolyspora halotolerans]
MNVTREPWRDRSEAGRELGEAVRATLGRRPREHGAPLVLGLPRGGVVVAAEVAAAVGGDLDVLVVRKVGVPWHRELALGAVTASDVRVYNSEVIRRTHLGEQDTEAAFARARAEAAEHEQRFRTGRPALSKADRPVVVVDDGIATGATTLAALQLLRKGESPPEHVTLAVPIAPADTVARLEPYTDDVVVLHTPRHFVAVGEWFINFTQVTDEEVQEFMAGDR